MLIQFLASTRAGLCNEQPTAHENIYSIPARSTNATGRNQHSYIDDKSFYEHDLVRPITQQPPSLKPLDLGEKSLFGKISAFGRQKCSPSQPTRPVIGLPTNFRRLDVDDAQRHDLVPLKLGPVVLRETPDPDALAMTARYGYDPSRSTDSLVLAADREPYQAIRNTPFERCQQISSSACGSPVVQQSDNPGSFQEPRPTRPPLSTHSSSSSIRSLRRQGTDNASTSSTPSKASIEWHRLKRIKSSQSMSRGGHEIEREILELNTIVEERRADATRSTAPTEHVPAVAPSMMVKARSETLNDIGSVFSRPLTAPRPTSIHASHARSLSATNIVRPASTKTASTSTSRAKSRVTGWLSGILPTTSSNYHHQTTPLSEPFYKCVPPPSSAHRPMSDASICTTVTQLESPGLTTASSPVSKGHSRTLTADSRFTSTTPPSFAYAHGSPADRKESEQEHQWPVVSGRLSQVGVAF